MMKHPDKNTPHPRTPWHSALFFRVMFLSIILILCLLGAVAIITRYYANEAAGAVQERAISMAGTITVRYEEEPNIPLNDLEQDLIELYAGEDIALAPLPADQSPMPGMKQDDETPPVYVERDKNGTLVRVTHMVISLGERNTLLTVRVPIQQSTEIFRAFTNRYMIAITIVFILALLGMIYIITTHLRPLSTLSETCAAIASGNLQTVSTKGATGEILALEESFNHMVDALAEKELVKTKLREAQRLSALGNLAAGVAHDVRNPLNAIKLLSSHALDNVEEGSSAAKPLSTIRKEVDRLEDIVSGFLSLAREKELVPEPNKVDVLLGECIHLIEKDAEDRGIAFSAELRAGDLTLNLDPKQWNRAILNLLLNAMEACESNGRVRIFSRVSDTVCTVEIRDNGPGLDSESLARIFEPYYTTKAGGTGLGLSITRGIVEEHGGRIEISSTPGQGCQVLITLPLEKVKP